MLNVAWDNRGGHFETVIAPCNCPADLSTKISYLAVEPPCTHRTVRFCVLYFCGTDNSVNLSKEFYYTQLKQPATKGDWSDINKTVFSRRRREQE
jgi:hypothetical protein